MAPTIKRWRKGTGQAKAQDTYSLADLDRVIRDYESERGMTSASFKAGWDSGQLDHGDFDLSRWALLLGAASVHPPTAS